MPDFKAFTNPGAWTKGTSMSDWFVERSLELSFTSMSMKPYAMGLGFMGQPYIYSEARRREIRAELDAAAFLLFGMHREDVEHILDSFPVLQRREIKAFGEYVSRNLVLAKYDAFS